jgi:hypothetical protein
MAPVVVVAAQTVLAIMAAHLVPLAVLVAVGRRMTYPAPPEAMPVVAVVAGMTVAAEGRLRRAVAPGAQAQIPRQPGPMPRQILVVAVVVAVVEVSQVDGVTVETAALAS